MYCPKCGKENPEDVNFCMHCGADLRKYKTYDREEQEVETEEAFKEAVQKYESEDYLEALRYLEPLLKFNDVKALALAGFCYGYLEKYENALECADQASNLSEDPKIWWQKAYYLSKLERYKETRDIAGKILLYLHPDEELKESVEALLRSAGSAETEKEGWEHIRESRERELKEDYGENYLRAKEIDGELSFLKAKSRIYKNDDEIKESVEKLKQELKKLKKKQKTEEMEKEERLRAEAVKEICEKAWAMYKSEEKYSEVLEYLKPIITDYTKLLGISDEAKAFFLAGICSRNIKEYEKALEYCNKALKIKPIRARPWFFKGILFDELEKYDEALNCFDMVSKIFMDSADGDISIGVDAWVSKGLTYRNLGKHEKALGCYDEAFMLIKEWGLSEDKIPEIFLFRANCFSNLGRNEEAKDCAEKALNMNPDESTKEQLKGILEA